MAPKGRTYQTDWLFSATSNVHIATNKEWFSSFTEFSGTLDSCYLGPGSGGQYLGVGDVELEVTKALDQGRMFCKKIVLRDVLYVPDFIANVFGQHADTGYLMDGLKKRKVVSRGAGTTLCKIDEKAVLPRLWLKKQKCGCSSLDRQGHYTIGALWSDEERGRWTAFKLAQASASGSRYSEEEKAWLKKNYRGEFRFLRQHKLSIYKEEDREEGRAIVKAMMEDDAERERL